VSTNVWRLPPGAPRLLLFLLLGVVAIAASARPPIAEDARRFALLVLAAVGGWTARSGLLLLAARKGALRVERGAPTHRLVRAAGLAALVGVAAAAPLLVAPARFTVAALIAAGLVGIGAGVLLAGRDTRTKGPRNASRFSWLVLDTALPAGALAALVGLAVALLRLPEAELVPPGALGRHLGGTVFLYAILLGLGGFAKGFGEKKAGLVLVAPLAVSAPGPVVVGGLLGLALLFGVPLFSPPLALATVIAWKGAGGFLLGGLLSLLGALAGARRAAAPESDGGV
jgi:hypothetical protein